MTNPVSAYIHIPFCRRRCFYCDFPVSIVGDKPPVGSGDRINGSNSGTIARYVEILCREIRQSSAAVPLKTVFFGGGTPSLLSVEQVETVLTALNQQFGIADSAEISLEIDPATFDLEQVKGYKAAGVNRVSLGVQAFQPQLLKMAGRSHTVEDIYTAVYWLRAAGFSNISMDLISGLPHQTLAQWQESLEKAIVLAPTHLSCYDLIVEAGTPFSRQYKPGVTPLPSDELAAEMYCTAQQVLTSSGFEHYEISNYAQPGYQCQHNRVYWKNRPFYGFGMGATSYVNGDRVARPRKTWEYYEWVERAEGRAQEAEGEGDREQGTEDRGLSDFHCRPSTVHSASDLLDTLMLGLRLAEGVDIAQLIETFGVESIDRVVQCLQPFEQEGLVTIEPVSRLDLMPRSGRLRLTDPKGFLFSNVVLTAIFEEFE